MMPLLTCNRTAVLIILMVIVSTVSGQVRPVQDIRKTPPNVRYTMGKRLEQQGNLDRAREIYEALYREYPNQAQYRNAYWNILKVQKQYEPLEHALNDYLLQHPNDLNTRIDLGEIYLLKGDTLKADNHWNTLLKTYPNKTQLFRMLFTTYFRLGLQEKMTDLVSKARAETGNPNFMAIDLAHYYHLSSQPEKAISEYLNVLTENPANLKFVSNRLLALTSETDTYSLLDSVLKDRIQEAPDFAPLRNLQFDNYINSRNFSAAYDEIRIIDSLENKKGSRILDFATLLLVENQFDMALDCFTFLLSDARYRNTYPEALLGLAKVYERKITTVRELNVMNRFLPGNQIFSIDLEFTVSDSLRLLSKAFMMYDSVLAILPDSKYSAEALFRIGDIQYRITRDLDNALNSFSRSIQMNRSIHHQLRCYSKISQVHFARGDITRALEVLETALNRIETPDAKKTLLPLKVKYLLFSGKIDSLQDLREELFTVFDGTNRYFNDLLDLYSFITVYGTDKQVFNRFLSAEALAQQGKLSESLSILTEIISADASEPVTAVARFRVGLIELQFGHYRSARELVLPLIENHDPLIGDEVAFTMGTYARIVMNDPEEMKFWFDTILLDYPTSLHIEVVRSYLRQYQ